VLPPIKKRIPTGVRVDLLSVNTPSIAAEQNGVVAAAKALHWKLTVITPQLTPQAYISALQSIAASKPRLLIYFAPFPLQGQNTELQTLKNEGVPIISAGAAGYPVGSGSPIIADGSGANVFGPVAKLMAEVDVAAAKGAPNAGWVVDPTVPAWTVMTSSFQ
jgi:hypothetical protein